MPDATVKCPNCLREHGIPEEPCMLGALASMLGQRGVNPEEALGLIERANPEHLWDDLGPILERLAVGYYDCEPEPETTNVE